MTVSAVIPKGPPAASVLLDPRRLAALLTVAAALTPESDQAACTLELHLGDSPKVVVRSKGLGAGQEFYGLMMPLSPDPRNPVVYAMHPLTEAARA